MFSIFQVLDVEEEQASPTTSIELDVIVENNSSFKSLWPSFYINILTLSVVTRQGWTCPFFSLHDFIWQRGEGRLFFPERGAGRPFLSVSSSQSSWSSPPPRSPPPSWWWSSHSWPGKQRGVCASNDAGQLEGTQHLLCKHSAMEFSVKEETGDCDWNDDDGGDYDNHCG